MAFVVDKIDKDKLNGVWQDWEGSEFLIASIENTKFMREYERMGKSKSRKSKDQQKHEMCKLLATSLVLDWKNVWNSAGEEVEYSVEMATEALKNNTDFLTWVMEAAGDTENFVKEDLEDLVKK